MLNHAYNGRAAKNAMKKYVKIYLKSGCSRLKHSGTEREKEDLNGEI
jgi:hypothetical protein